MATRRAVALAGLVFCALTLPRFGFARHLPVTLTARAADEMNFTLEGKITEKSGNKLTVSGSENMIFHVIYNEKTEIRKKDGSAGTGEDLHTGVNISAAGDLAESGEITAKKIEIEGEASGKP